MRTRLFMCLGLVALLTWSAATPGLAQEGARDRGDHQSREYRQQRSHEQPQYSQRQRNQRQYNQRQYNQREYRQQQQYKQRQQVGQDRRRAPSSLLPDDEKGRTVMQQFMPHDRARQAVQAGEIRSYGDIRRAVQQRFNGRIVGMELHENRGRGPAYVYDVRVLTKSGEVLSVDMDAHTGQVLGVRGGR